MVVTVYNVFAARGVKEAPHGDNRTCGLDGNAVIGIAEADRRAPSLAHEATRGFPARGEFIHSERITCFTMESRLADISTYSGVQVCSPRYHLLSRRPGLPLVTVSSRARVISASASTGRPQHEDPDPWDPAKWAQPLQARVAVPIEGRDVWVGGWLYVLEGHMGGRQPVILLDTIWRKIAPGPELTTTSTAATRPTGSNRRSCSVSAAPATCLGLSGA
jgi:hypothetical protein